VFGNAFALPSNLSASCATLVDYDRNGTLDIVGMDELADEMTFWDNQLPPAVDAQAATCRATLRIDNKGHSAGFGTQAPQDIGLGKGFQVGITAAPATLVALLAGMPQTPGVLHASGLLNMEPGWVLLQINTTDAKGEFSKKFHVPTNLPVGQEFALQVLANDPLGYVLSNPHTLKFTP